MNVHARTTFSVFGVLITPRASGTYSYRYSGSGQRIWESAGGTVRRTVRGTKGEALAVFDGSGNLVHWNMSGGLGRMGADGLRYYEPEVQDSQPGGEPVRLTGIPPTACAPAPLEHGAA